MVDDSLRQQAILGGQSKIKRLRELGITIPYIAKLVNAKDPTVYAWLHGVAPPKSETLPRLNLVLRLAEAVAEELPEHIYLFFSIDFEILGDDCLVDTLAGLDESYEQKIEALPQEFVTMVRRRNT